MQNLISKGDWKLSRDFSISACPQKSSMENHVSIAEKFQAAVSRYSDSMIENPNLALEILKCFANRNDQSRISFLKSVNWMILFFSAIRSAMPDGNIIEVPGINEKFTAVRLLYGLTPNEGE